MTTAVAKKPLVRDGYPNGECPDCGEDIPTDCEDGGECGRCGYVLRFPPKKQKMPRYKKMKAPKLKIVDLNKCCRSPEGGGFHDHPDIRTEKQYLVKYNGCFHAGTFSPEWYGWCFNGIYSAGAQLDKPGTNASAWQGLWEIC